MNQKTQLRQDQRTESQRAADHKERARAQRLWAKRAVVRRPENIAEAVPLEQRPVPREVKI